MIRRLAALLGHGVVHWESGSHARTARFFKWAAKSACTKSAAKSAWDSRVQNKVLVYQHTSPIAGIDLGPGTRTKNPLGAWLDDQSADSIPPLLRAVVAHRSAGLLRRTSRRGNSRSRRRWSSRSWRSSGRSRGRTGAAGLAGDVSSCSRSDAYFFGLPRGRAPSGIEFSATLVG